MEFEEAAMDISRSNSTSPMSDSGGCLICGKNDEHQFILLCDGCDGEFHTHCLTPPLDHIPEGDWFCQACMDARTHKQTRLKKSDPTRAVTAMLPTASTSKFYGVSKTGKGWQAKITSPKEGETVIGIFQDEEMAARAYDQVAMDLYGSTAELNFPGGMGVDLKEMNQPRRRKKAKRLAEYEYPDVTVKGLKTRAGDTASGATENGPRATLIEHGIVKVAEGKVLAPSPKGKGAAAVVGWYPIDPTVQDKGKGEGTGKGPLVVNSDKAKSPRGLSMLGGFPTGEQWGATVKTKKDVRQGKGIARRGIEGVAKEGKGISGGTGTRKDVGIAAKDAPDSIVISDGLGEMCKTVRSEETQDLGSTEETEKRAKSGSHNGGASLRSKGLGPGSSVKSHSLYSALARSQNETLGRKAGTPGRVETDGVMKKWKGGYPSKKSKERTVSKSSKSSEGKEREMAIVNSGLVGEDGNQFLCGVCGKTGEVLCCDNCPKVFHKLCLALGSKARLAAEFQSEADPWFCPHCVKAGKLNTINGETPDWASMKQAMSKVGEGSISRSTCVEGEGAGIDPCNNVSPSAVFAPELANRLLYSLLYEDFYVAPRHPRRLCMREDAEKRNGEEKICEPSVFSQEGSNSPGPTGVGPHHGARVRPGFATSLALRSFNAVVTPFRDSVQGPICKGSNVGLPVAQGELGRRPGGGALKFAQQTGTVLPEVQHCLKEGATPDADHDTGKVYCPRVGGNSRDNLEPSRRNVSRGLVSPGKGPSEQMGLVQGWEVPDSVNTPMRGSLVRAMPGAAGLGSEIIELHFSEDPQCVSGVQHSTFEGDMQVIDKGEGVRNSMDDIDNAVFRREGDDEGDCMSVDDNHSQESGEEEQHSDKAGNTYSKSNTEVEGYSLDGNSTGVTWVVGLEGSSHHRMWNLKHMQVCTGGDEVGQRKSCFYCSGQPDGAAMACPNSGLANVHIFCFLCLDSRWGLEKSLLVKGRVKWECPACMELSQRKRRISSRSSVGSSDKYRAKNSATRWEDGEDGRRREGRLGRGVEGHAGSRGGSWDDEEVVAETHARPSGDDSRMNLHNDPEVVEKPSKEEGRLLRLVYTIFVDHLQRGDPYKLFAEPVDPNVPGYAEVIRWPMDFSTIRGKIFNGEYLSMGALARDIALLCGNAITFNPPGTIYHSIAKSMLETAEMIWPSALDLLNHLWSVEMLAEENGRAGPNTSGRATAALEGRFAGFELTPANEDAYYMHLAVTRAATASRTAETEGLCKAGHVKGSMPAPSMEAADGDVDLTMGTGNRGKEELDSEAVRVAVNVATSLVELYTPGDMWEEECLLREAVATSRSHRREEETRNESGSARCNPIDSAMREAHKYHSIPLAIPKKPTLVPDSPESKSNQTTSKSHATKAHSTSNGRQPASEPVKAAAGSGGQAPEWKVVEAAEGMARGGEEGKRLRSIVMRLLRLAAGRLRTRFRVEASKVQGLGVFANEGIRAHELVGEFLGEQVGRTVADRRVAEYKKAGLSNFMQRIGDGTFLDATRKGNMLRFVNHSCEPNCHLRMVEIAGHKRMFIFALQELEAGEELLYSYPPLVGSSRGEVAPRCCCGAPSCWGRISVPVH